MFLLPELAQLLSPILPKNPITHDLEEYLSLLDDNDHDANELYEILLWQKLYILGDQDLKNNITENNATSFSLKELNINGERKLPVFTSIELMREYIDQKEHYISVYGNELLLLLRSSNVHLVVNPEWHAECEIHADEISRLGQLLAEITVENE